MKFPDWTSQYINQWPEQTPQELKAAQLAERYHRETEAYDRTVCTGPPFHGSAMPATCHEHALINRYAHAKMREIMEEAARAGISREAVGRAIARAELRQEGRA